MRDTEESSRREEMRIYTRVTWMLSQKGGHTRRVQAAKLYPRGIQIRIVLFLQETDWPVGRQD